MKVIAYDTGDESAGIRGNKIILDLGNLELDSIGKKEIIANFNRFLYRNDIVTHVSSSSLSE